MTSRTLLVVGLAFALVGCPSKEGEQKDAQTSSGNAGNGTGPLANLESSPFMNEVWIGEGGQQVAMLFYARENLRVSAQCRHADGTLACDAIRQVRNGMPVEIPRRMLDGRTSAGVKVCQRLGRQMATLHNSVGAEDGMCIFPDGSMLSNGALEQYAMRVSE